MRDHRHPARLAGIPRRIGGGSDRAGGHCGDQGLLEFVHDLGLTGAAALDALAGLLTTFAEVDDGVGAVVPVAEYPP